MSTPRWLSILLLVLAAISGVAFVVQRETTAMLRAEVELLRDETRRLARLRAECEKLSAALPTPEELQRLRADHAAVVRLRNQIEQMRARADQMARDAAAVTQATAPRSAP